MGNKGNCNSLHSRTRQAYEDLGFKTENHDLLGAVVEQLKAIIGEDSLILKDYSIRDGKTRLAGRSLTPRAIKNVVILYEIFKLTHRPIAQLLSGVKTEQKEGLDRLFSNYEVLKNLLPRLKAACASEEQVLVAFEQLTGDISKLNLQELLQSGGAGDETLSPVPIQQHRLLHDVLDDLRSDDAYGPWRLVNRLIGIGALSLAEKRLDELQTDEEPGVTLGAYLRARIALAQFGMKRRDAFRNRMLSKEMDPLSGAEQAYAQMADDDEGDAEREDSKVAGHCMIAWRTILRRPENERARIAADLGEEMSTAIEEIISHLLRWYGPRAMRWGSADAAWDCEAPPPSPEDRAALLQAAKAVETNWRLSAASGSRFRAYAAHIMQKLDPGSEATAKMVAGLRNSLIAQEQHTLTGESWLDPMVAPLVEEDDALTAQIFEARFAALEAARCRARARPAFREIVATLRQDGPDAAWLHLNRLKAEGRLPQDRDSKIIARLTVGRFEYAVARLVVEGKVAAIRAGVETDCYQPLYTLVPRISAALAEHGLPALPDDAARIVSDQKLYEEYFRIEPSDDFDDDEPGDQDWERDQHCLFRDELYLLIHYPKRNWGDETPPWPYP